MTLSPSVHEQQLANARAKMKRKNELLVRMPSSSDRESIRKFMRVQSNNDRLGAELKEVRAENERLKGETVDTSATVASVKSDASVRFYSEPDTTFSVAFDYAKYP